MLSMYQRFYPLALIHAWPLDQTGPDDPYLERQNGHFVAAKLTNELGIFLASILFFESIKTTCTASFTLMSKYNSRVFWVAAYCGQFQIGKQCPTRISYTGL